MADTLFTWGPSNVTSLLTTTLSNYRRELSDNIFTAIPLFAWLTGKNRMTEDGGASLVIPIEYVKNTTAKEYDGDDILDTTIQDPYTAAQYQWRQYAASVPVTGRIERVQNQGKHAVINYVKSLIKSAGNSIRDRMNIHLYQSSVLSKRINSLPVLIDATSTVGDINSSTNSWWQATVTASGSFAAQGLSDLRGVYNQIDERMPQGAPDFMVSDRTAFEAYEATVVPSLRFQDTRMADLGFTNLKYKGAVWTHDVNATSGNIFLLQSDAVQLVTSSGTNFIMSEMVKPADQDLRVGQILWAGELVSNNRRKLGKLTGVTA